MTSGHLDGAAYDRVAARWHETRSPLPPPLRALLDTVIVASPPTPEILDVGCGSGVPIARYLARHGCTVTGIDASTALLEIARREVPDAHFVHGDMRDVEPGGTFDAIVAWDTVFHIPRDDHALVFRRFAEWLRPAGLLLLSLGATAWEGTSEMLGETFFYSGHDEATSRRLLDDSGFDIEQWEIDDPSSRGHLAILARRRVE